MRHSIDKSRTQRSIGKPNALNEFIRGYEQELITPLYIPGLNNEDWLEPVSSFFGRDLKREDSLLEDLALAEESIEHIGRRTSALSNTPFSKHTLKDPQSGFCIPPIPADGLARQRAIDIAARLFKVARRDRERVRFTVSGYALAASKRMRVVLHRTDEERYGRSLIRLVESLEIPRIGCRLVGFRVAGREADLSGWLRRLRLSLDTPIHWVLAPNQRAARSADQIGIEIIDTTRGRASGIFHLAMLWAFTLEVWRLPRFRRSSRRKPFSPSEHPMDLFGENRSA